MMIQFEIDNRGVATLTLNRPEKNNALNMDMISLMHEAIKKAEQPDVRVLYIRGAGNNFCAGADLKWMKEAVTLSREENFKQAKALAELMYDLYNHSRPTVVEAQGSVYGGGVGLVAICDIAFAARSAEFCCSEVRLGLIPAVISPYLMAAMGPRHAQKHMLTARPFSAKRAERDGLIHEMCVDEQLHDRVESTINDILANGPTALKETKRIVKELRYEKITEQLMDVTADRIAEIRASAEAQEGMAAFFAKRDPNWIKGAN
jgi:methylglutaconyl-CoA hydratase